MIALLFLVLSVLASLALVTTLFSKLRLFEQLALSWIVSVIGSSWITLGLVALCGYTLGISASFILFIVVIAKFFPHKTRFRADKLTLPFLIFLVSWSVIFMVVFNKALLPSSAQGLNTLAYSYGDIALHSSYINYFAEQSKLSLQSPIFSTEIIKYPFLFNFHTALVVKMGLSVHWALVITSMLTIISALTFFYQFCFNITKKATTPVLASLIYFLNGGAFGWKSFEDWKLSGETLNNFITHLPIDYTNAPELNIFWTNVITTHLVPQRGFLFGFAFLVSFLFLWQHIWYQKKAGIKHYLFLSTVVGLLPFFHSYTFLVTLPLMGWLVAWQWRLKKLSIKESVLVLLPGLLLGVVQVLFLASDKNFIHLLIGWKAGTTSWLYFWWQNMGLSFIFLLISPLFFGKAFKNRSYEKIIILPLVVIFVLCNIFIFQPHDWDNMKFFLLAFTFTAITTAAVMTKFWKNAGAKILICLILVFSCLSGLLSVLFTSQYSWNIATTTDIQLANHIKETTNSDAVFLTSNTHNHLVPMLAGRAVVRGYRGWLWTHGIDYSSVDLDIEKIYGGSPMVRELLNQYSIDYVFIGPTEQYEYEINQDFFETNFEVFYKDSQTIIYKVS